MNTTCSILNKISNCYNNQDNINDGAMHLASIFDNNTQTFQHQNQLEQILLYTSTIIGLILLLRHENKLFASYLKYIFQLE